MSDMSLFAVMLQFMLNQIWVDLLLLLKVQRLMTMVTWKSLWQQARSLEKRKVIQMKRQTQQYPNQLELLKSRVYLWARQNLWKKLQNENHGPSCNVKEIKGRDRKRPRRGARFWSSLSRFVEVVGSTCLFL